MKNILSKFFILILTGWISSCFAMENLFYILRSNAPSHITSIQAGHASLYAHPNAINILVSQAYQVDEHGMVWGFIDPDVLAFTRKNNMKLMALITNVDFDKDRTHQFFSDSGAQTRAIASIVDACKKLKLYGVQFDFEMMPLRDRDALTQFYRAATTALHKNGFVVSYAVAPVVADSLQTSDFQKRLYERWEGVYDLKALADAGDFVSVMAYNQHGEGTTPGPTASAPWVEAVIQYTLQYVPADKISLGIPAYSNYWYTGTSSDSSTGRISTRLAGIPYNQIEYLLKKYKVALHWNDIDKVNSTVYEHNWLDEYIFAEDAKSFQAKLDLANKYHLRGVSVFDIGSEDPGIWGVMGAKSH